MDDHSTARATAIKGVETSTESSEDDVTLVKLSFLFIARSSRTAGDGSSKGIFSLMA